MIKVMTIFGTRPEAIKMAPLVKELEKHPAEFQSIVTVTAQHREMLDQVLEVFSIKPDYDLNVMQPKQTLFDITTKVLQGLAKVMEESQPDIVLVHGDTTTTFVGSLAAFYNQIPVGHVEAGLRTSNKYSPFPEEMNRRLTGALADLHFAPTSTSLQNLLNEGKDRESIYVTGNTVIDALLSQVNKKYEFQNEVLQSIDYDQKRVILVTTHRRENWGKPLENIYLALKEIVHAYNDIELVFPIHKNPTVRATAERILGNTERIHMIEPLEYLEFINLMNKSYLILTDSGGVQEEAPSLGKPVLVLRENTERPEALEAGTVKLVGTDKDVIAATVKRLLDNQEDYLRMANAVNPYGDGQASQRIVHSLLYHFKKDIEKTKEFTLTEEKF